MQIDVKTAITIATALLAASGAWWASKGDISANSARIEEPAAGPEPAAEPPEAPAARPPTVEE